MLHSNLLIPTPLFPLPPLSEAENQKIAVSDDLLPPFLTTDLSPSKVKLNDASETSLFPTLSWALVSRECIPSVILSIWNRLAHVINFDLSKLHSKWLRPTPLSVPDNSNFAVVDEVLPPVLIVDILPSVTEFIEVSGATVSTVQLKDEGEISTFPTLS